jgi:hypothetical protein
MRRRRSPGHAERQGTRLLRLGLRDPGGDNMPNSRNVDDGCSCFHSLVLVAEVLKHVQPDRRGQIALLARLIDPCNKF